MGYYIHMDAANRTAFVRLEGEVDAPLMMEAIDAVYDHEIWENDFDMVWDGRATTRFSMTPDELFLLRDRSAESVARGVTGRFAVVASEFNVVAISKLYEMYAQQHGRRVKVFRVLEDAMEWLERPISAIPWGPESHIPDDRLKPGMIPEAGDDWPVVREFGRLFDGVRALGSIDRCATVAEARNPANLTELRACLFYEVRRWEKIGSDPDDEAMSWIRTLVEKIAAEVEARGERS